MMQEKEGGFYKECGVVRLKTEDQRYQVKEGELFINDSTRYDWGKLEALRCERVTVNGHAWNGSGIRTYINHLYITSDDEIKEGDWYVHKQIGDYQIGNYRVQQCVGTNLPMDAIKIIATTDTSLRIPDFPELENTAYRRLPQPSDKFIQAYIEAYNKGEKIYKVLVAYSDLGDGRVVFQHGMNNTIIIEQSEINYKEELEKCKKSVWYFMTKYATINGRPFTTHMSEEEFNKSLTL